MPTFPFNTYLHGHISSSTHSTVPFWKFVLSNFRFSEKIEQKIQRISIYPPHPSSNFHIPTPSLLQFPLLLPSSTESAHLLQLMSQCGYIVTNRSPRIVRFRSLLAVYFPWVWTNVQWHRYGIMKSSFTALSYGIMQSGFTALKVPCALLIPPSPTSAPGIPWWFHCLHSFAFSI